jgi:hypothetical protein
VGRPGQDQPRRPGHGSEPATFCHFANGRRNSGPGSDFVAVGEVSRQMDRLDRGEACRDHFADHLVVSHGSEPYPPYAKDPAVQCMTGQVHLHDRSGPHLLTTAAFPRAWNWTIMLDGLRSI